MADYSDAYKSFKYEEPVDPKPVKQNKGHVHIADGKKGKHAVNETTIESVSGVNVNHSDSASVFPDWGHGYTYSQVITKHTKRTYKSYNDEGKLESEEVEETIEYAAPQQNTPWIITNSSNTTVG